MTKKKLQDLFFDCKVAGVSFPNRNGSSRQEAIEELAGKLATTEDGLALELRREPDNPYDPNAVAVLHEDRQIGYIPRQGAVLVAPLLDAGIAVTAEALSAGRAEGGKQFWGVGMRIKYRGVAP